MTKYALGGTSIHMTKAPGPEVIKLELIFKLIIKRYDCLLADTCPQAANHSALL